MFRISFSEYPYSEYKGTNLSRNKRTDEPISLIHNTLFIILYHGRYFKVLDTLFHILQLNNVFLIVVHCSGRLPIIETAHLYTSFVRHDSDFSVVMKCVALFPTMTNCHLKVPHEDVANCTYNR